MEAEEVGEPGHGGGQGACQGLPVAPRFPGCIPEGRGETVTWAMSSLGCGHQLCYY